MRRQITARYPGRCAATGAPIKPGDPIIYDTKSRKAYAQRAPQDELTAAAALAHDIDPELDTDTAANVGLYMMQSSRRYQSDIWRAGGKDYYRNKAGLCEDAPCCGCCNA